MPAIRIFEPALCCNTGVCGPELDQELVTFTADVNALQEQGVDVQRANLASDPALFAQNPVVVTFLQAAGSEGLPLTLVDDVTVLTGRHPSRQELLRYAGQPEQGERAELPVVTSGCCGGGTATGSSGCC
ncbi:arsenite efflux transporter metallochaperone ArsD [Tessaracoccus sp. SD287]|uniref:arsenite efflux transporter metallochaperone ArsD n=1 Tax=Tessaracoccus sp. SD287 TaxID=2782008 RepID=UPI001A96AB43|nr:arsenite efflux transporter metallochaperone ArsD [Tessaracoccus sp. SD287]MBO1031294.1 arsenite efflux transporter metallochaperone ArsD [Tessaracoccus sp. SD287]